MQKMLKKLSVSAPCGEYESITAILARQINFGWAECELPEDRYGWEIYSENGEFLESLAREITAFVPSAAFKLEYVENKDWSSAWKEFFTPVYAGRFAVVPPWLASESAGSILIEPKSAFGTGHHASTALCLMAIDKLAAAGRIAACDRFLDLGCGTGILSLACAQCGLNGIAIDNDPLAIENARENIALNKASGIAAVVGSIENVDGDRFNLIVANILARPLIEMAAPICAALSSKGILALSGMLGHQVEDVANTYMACGLAAPEQLAEGEWRALIFEK